MSYSQLAESVERLNDTNQSLVDAVIQHQNVIKVADYAALRKYRGTAKTVQVSKTGLTGIFDNLGFTGQTEVTGVFIVDNDGRVWGRRIETKVQSSWFEPKGDGVSDDSQAFKAFWVFLAKFGLDGHVNKGKYSISSECSAALDSNFGVTCDTNVEFVAASGFPAGASIFRVTNSLVPNRTFKWIGARFDGSRQPYTADGSGSGCALLSVNASNCSHCHIEIDRTYTGDDWLNTGGDSHLFVGGPRNMYLRIYEAIGAPDSAIYVSRNFAGEIGESLDVDGNFYKCAVGVIVKRQFESAKVKASGTDCMTVAAVGQADITGYESTNGGSNYHFEVNAKRCQYPLFLQAVRGVTGIVNVDRLGVSIPGFTSSDACGVRFRGAKDCNVILNISGANPSTTVNNAVSAVFFGPITNAKDGTLDSTGNLVTMNARGLGVPFIEDGSGSNNNTVTGKWDAGLTNVPVIVGSSTRYALQFGNLEVFNRDLRKADNSNRIVWNVASDGSTSQGVRGSGVVAPVYTDYYSSGNASRDGRLIVTGGTSAADSGVLGLQFGQVSLLAPAVDFTNVARPATTGVGTLGQSSRVWSTGFVQTALTVTSDENYKTDISDIPDEVLNAWSQVDYKTYRLRDAVELKGDGARLHVGVIAQRVKEAFESLGLDPFAIGVLCYDEWESSPAVYDADGNTVTEAIEAGSRYSIRYEEALALEAALLRRAMVDVQKRLSLLESK